jgi:K+-transporting ATPase ATPase B chain
MSESNLAVIGTTTGTMTGPDFGPSRRLRRQPLLTKETTLQALKQAFIMLRPDVQWKNPVMFVVEVGAILTFFFIFNAASAAISRYFIALEAWLWATVLFANFATALAEARGKAQAESLRRSRRNTIAYRLVDGEEIEEVSSSNLKPGDRVVMKLGK